MKTKRVPNAEGQKRLHRAMTEFGHAQGKVGYFETAKYPDGTPVASAAYWNEFGVAEKNIPPRPTMRPAADETKKEWKVTSLRAMKAILNGGETMVSVMEKLCDRCAGTIRKNIKTLTSPPLAISTILARQSIKNQNKKVVSLSLAKPLVHTGLMLDSPTYKVEKK